MPTYNLGPCECCDPNCGECEWRWDTSLATPGWVKDADSCTGNCNCGPPQYEGVEAEELGFTDCRHAIAFNCCEEGHGDAVAPANMKYTVLTAEPGGVCDFVVGLVVYLYLVQPLTDPPTWRGSVVLPNGNILAVLFSCLGVSGSAFNYTWTVTWPDGTGGVGSCQAQLLFGGDYTCGAAFSALFLAENCSAADGGGLPGVPGLGCDLEGIPFGMDAIIEVV